MLGHVARLIAKAWANWAWVPPVLRDELALVGGKIVNQWYDWTAQKLEEQLASPVAIANIPLIGMLGVLQAGFIAGDKKTIGLRQNVEDLLFKWLNHFGQGYTEGVSYDGYIWDHAVDCLSLVHQGKLPGWFTQLPHISRLLSNSYELACPGKADLHVAPDVTLQLSSPNRPFTQAMLDRLSGSRGQQTLSVSRTLTPPGRARPDPVVGVLPEHGAQPVVKLTDQGLLVDGRQLQTAPAS